MKASVCSEMQDARTAKPTFINRTQQCFAVKSAVNDFLDLARATFCRLTEEIHLLADEYRQDYGLPHMKVVTAMPSTYPGSVLYIMHLHPLKNATATAMMPAVLEAQPPHLRSVTALRSSDERASCRCNTRLGGAFFSCCLQSSRQTAPTCRRGCRQDGSALRQGQRIVQQVSINSVLWLTPSYWSSTKSCSTNNRRHLLDL